MASTNARSLKIKTGVLKRASKELVMYQNEVTAQQAKIEKLKADGGNEYDVRKQKEVLQESVMMVPDTQKRLLVAFTDVEALVKLPDLEGTEDLKVAQELLEQVRPQIAEFSASG